MVVAVPYYGPLVRPAEGLEKIFFVARVDRTSGGVRSLDLSVWNPHDFPAIGTWMKRQKVAGLICSDRNPKIEADLAERGIWVASVDAGGTDDMIRQWHAMRPKEAA